MGPGGSMVWGVDPSFSGCYRPRLLLACGEGKGCPLQYSCLKNSMGRGAWFLQSMGLQRVGHD